MELSKTSMSDSVLLEVSQYEQGTFVTFVLLAVLTVTAKRNNTETSKMEYADKLSRKCSVKAA